VTGNLKVIGLAAAVLLAVAVPVAIAHADDEPLWGEDGIGDESEAEVFGGFGVVGALDADHVADLNERAAALAAHLDEAGIEHETVTLDVVTWDVTDPAAREAVADFHAEHGFWFFEQGGPGFGEIPFEGELSEELEACLEAGEGHGECFDLLPFEIGELPFDGEFPFFEGRIEVFGGVPFEEMEACLEEMEAGEGHGECFDLLPFDLGELPFDGEFPFFDGEVEWFEGLPLDGEIVEVAGEVCVTWAGEIPEVLVDPDLELPIVVHPTDDGAEICLDLSEAVLPGAGDDGEGGAG